MSRILISLINFYQGYLSFDTGILMFLAPGGACKGDPRCSEYMKIKILEQGPVLGVLLGIRRIIACR